MITSTDSVHKRFRWNNTIVYRQTLTTGRRENSFAEGLVELDFPTGKEKGIVKSKLHLIVIAALLMAVVISTEGLAARRVIGRKGPKQTQVVVTKRHVVKPHVIEALPPDPIRVVVKDKDYFFHRGIWYGPGSDGYKVIVAPRGARVKVLPVGHTVVIIGGVNYYHYYGAYYRFDDQTSEYYVVDPPEDAQTTDILYLVDGDVLKGRYIGGNDQLVRFQVGDEISEIDLTDIVSISFEPPSE
jgi:hypothetical protein